MDPQRTRTSDAFPPDGTALELFVASRRLTRIMSTREQHSSIAKRFYDSRQTTGCKSCIIPRPISGRAGRGNDNPHRGGDFFGFSSIGSRPSPVGLATRSHAGSLRSGRGLRFSRWRLPIHTSLGVRK